MRHSEMERSDAQTRRSTASASDTPSLATARDFLADAFRRRPVAYRNELWSRYKRLSHSDNRARFDEALETMIAAGNVFEVRDAHGRKQYTMDRPRRVTVTPPAAPEPCRALAPLSHFVTAYRQPGGKIGFCAANVSEPMPTLDGARWLAQFLEV